MVRSITSIFLLVLGSALFGVHSFVTFVEPRSNRVWRLSSSSDPTATDQELYDIAQRLVLDHYHDGRLGWESRDKNYGLEVLETQVETDGGLGLVLTELGTTTGGGGLVLVSDVTGNAAKANPAIYVGDTLTCVKAGEATEQTTGLDYDGTVEAIGRAKEACLDGKLTLSLNRLVKRAVICVEVDNGNNKIQTFDALAGENLRRLLLRNDVPISVAGNCGGEGTCGTCLVKVLQGEQQLNSKNHVEQCLMRNRQPSWRATCQTIVGANNQPGTLRIRLLPQYDNDQDDPDTKSLAP